MNRYLPRKERQDEILMAAIGHRQVGRKTFTLYLMARWLGMSPSMHLKRIIDELYAQGFLDRKVMQHRADVVKHVYSLTEAALATWRLL